MNAAENNQQSSRSCADFLRPRCVTRPTVLATVGGGVTQTMITNQQTHSMVGTHRTHAHTTVSVWRDLSDTVVGRGAVRCCVCVCVLLCCVVRANALFKSTSNGLRSVSVEVIQWTRVFAWNWRKSPRCACKFMDLNLEHSAFCYGNVMWNFLIHCKLCIYYNNNSSQVKIIKCNCT